MTPMCGYWLHQSPVITLGDVGPGEVLTTMTLGGVVQTVRAHDLTLVRPAQLEDYRRLRDRLVADEPHNGWGWLP